MLKSAYFAKKEVAHSPKSLTIEQIISIIIAILGLLVSIIMLYSIDSNNYIYKFYFCMIVIMAYLSLVVYFTWKLVIIGATNLFYKFIKFLESSKEKLINFYLRKTKKELYKKEKYDSNQISKELKYFELNNSNLVKYNEGNYSDNTLNKEGSNNNNFKNAYQSDLLHYNPAAKNISNFFNSEVNNKAKVGEVNLVPCSKNINQNRNSINSNRKESLQINQVLYAPLIQVNESAKKDKAVNENDNQVKQPVSAYLKNIFSNQVPVPNDVINQDNNNSNNKFMSLCKAENNLNLGNTTNTLIFNSNDNSYRKNESQFLSKLSFLFNSNLDKQSDRNEIKNSYSKNKQLNKILNEIYSSTLYIKNLKPLNDDELKKIDSTEISQKLKKLGFNGDLRRYVNNLKGFCVNLFFQKLLDYFDCTLCNINDLLKCYKIEFTNDIELALNYVNDIDTIITERVNSSNIFYNYLIGNYDKNFNNQENNNNMKNNNSDSMTTIYILWADLDSIELLKNKIKDKLKNLKLMNNINNDKNKKIRNENSDQTVESYFFDDKSGRTKKDSFINSTTNSRYYDNFTNNFSKEAFNNNFNSNLFDNSDLSNPLKFNFITSRQYPTILLRNQQSEDSLEKLILELDNLVKVNKLIAPSVLKINCKEEYLVIMNYCISRINELQKDFSAYNYNSGGSWLGREWISFFPSDAMLIANILLKQLAESLVENNETLTKCLLLSYPIRLSLEQNDNKNSSNLKNNTYKLNSGSLFIYNSSPDQYECYFNVIFKETKIQLNSVSLITFR